MMLLLKILFWQARLTITAWRMRGRTTATQRAQMIYYRARFDAALGALGAPGTGGTTEIVKYRELTREEDVRGAIMDHMSAGARQN